VLANASTKHRSRHFTELSSVGCGTSRFDVEGGLNWPAKRHPMSRWLPAQGNDTAPTSPLLRIGMTVELGLERLFGWVRLRSAPQRVDPADVGTAYRMELSVDSAEGRKRPKDASKASDKAAPPPRVVRRGRR
jgi:hypothetical protein